MPGSRRKLAKQLVQAVDWKPNYQTISTDLQVERDGSELSAH